LRSLGINRLDWVVATRPLEDHVGGLAWVLSEFRHGLLLHAAGEEKPEAFRALLPLAKASLDLSRQEPPGSWKGRVRLLSPLKASASKKKSRVYSNVALEVGGWLLLPGDMPEGGERRLLWEGNLKPVALLKANLNGSPRASSPEFLGTLSPQALVIACGRRNFYGLPSAWALSNIKASGARLYRTDLQGMIAFEWRGGRLKAEPWHKVPEKALWEPGGKRQRIAWKRLEKEGRIPGSKAGGPEEGEL
jgi:competence protein ComEC